jgi:hypothetical protein
MGRLRSGCPAAATDKCRSRATLDCELRCPDAPAIILNFSVRAQGWAVNSSRYRTAPRTQIVSVVARSLDQIRTGALGLLPAGCWHRTQLNSTFLLDIRLIAVVNSDWSPPPEAVTVPALNAPPLAVTVIRPFSTPSWAWIQGT